MSDIPNYDRDYLNPPPGYEIQERNDPYDYCVDCGAEILPGNACYRIGGRTYLKVEAGKLGLTPQKYEQVVQRIADVCGV